MAKLRPDLSGLVYSTFVGGTRADTGAAIAVDTAGNAYVTGGTSSIDFPALNALQNTNQSESPAQMLSWSS